MKEGESVWWTENLEFIIDDWSIEKGIVGDFTICPVTIALSHEWRCPGFFWLVEMTEKQLLITLWPDDGWSHVNWYYKVPENLERFIRDFHSGKLVKEGKFTIRRSDC